MIALVFLATVINYLDRQTLSVAAPVLREQFHMSNQDYSRVVFAFMLAYTISNGFSGGAARPPRYAGRLRALHRCRGRPPPCCTPWPPGPLFLAASRFLLGIGEAGNWPAGVKVVAEWFPERERALASGIFNSGSSVGAILAPPLVAWIILNSGWRAAFLAGGLVRGLPGCCSGGPTYHVPEAAKDEMPPCPRYRVCACSARSFVWSFMLSKIFLDPVWYFYIFWFPEYLKNARHFSMASIGKYGWIPFMVAGIGNLLGGWICGLLIKRGWSVTLRPQDDRHVLRRADAIRYPRRAGR